jgi:hypothetical protein
MLVFLENQPEPIIEAGPSPPENVPYVLGHVS